MQNQTSAQALPRLTYSDLYRGITAIAETAAELATTATNAEDKLGIVSIEASARHIIDCLNQQGGRCLRG